MAREACVKRLQVEIDGPWARFGSRPVMGRVSDSSLRIWKRIRYRNSFQTCLSAKLVEQDGRTRIGCRFSLHPFAVVFMAVWFGAVVLIGGMVIVVSTVAFLADPSAVPPFVWLGLAIPIVMIAFGIGLIRFGRYLARDERQFLLEFLRQTIGATAA